MNLKLKDLFIGYNDGKNEAAFRDNFEDYFYNYNDIYEEITRKDKYLLLGRKGTGKTLLAEYVKKKSALSGRGICEICSCKEFDFNKLFQFKTKDITPNQYRSVWEWLILVKIAQLINYDDTIVAPEKDLLVKFIKNCFYDNKLKLEKIVECTKSDKIKGIIAYRIFGCEKEVETKAKYQECSYLDYLSALKANIFRALEGSGLTYNLFLDELDDKFKNEELYKSNIISLIKVVDALNAEFLSEDINVKIVVVLRSDLFYLLNDADLNKIEQDNALKINWGSSSKINSPLALMVLLKLHQSVENILDQSITYENTISELFPQEIVDRRGKSEKLLEYMLDRTFFRPRDLITFLRCTINEDKDIDYFSVDNVKKAEQEYSDYLLKEVKNELHGHYNEKVISESILLLQQFKKKRFKYNDIADYHAKHSNLYKNIDLEETLRILFDFSVIGNFWSDKSKKLYYTWKYRENTTVDFDKEFIIHKGLIKALNIN